MSMGIYLPNMELPTSCRSCRFAGFGGRRCELNVCIFTGESQPTLSQERMSACPLVPVPPHVINFDKPYSFTISWDGEQLKGDIIGTAI